LEGVASLTIVLGTKCAPIPMKIKKLFNVSGGIDISAVNTPITTSRSPIEKKMARFNDN
jgi:hypothetical protein